MAPTAAADGRQVDRLDGYTKHWQKDLNKEANVDTENRLDSYADVVNGTLFILFYPAIFIHAV